MISLFAVAAGGSETDRAHESTAENLGDGRQLVDGGGGGMGLITELNI
jgi:hypothetical protein